MRMSGGWTPAHCAAERGSVKILQALIDAGVSVTMEDNSGDTPRKIALVYGREKCIELLDR